VQNTVQPVEFSYIATGLSQQIELHIKASIVMRISSLTVVKNLCDFLFFQVLQQACALPGVFLK
jgi:hypothetical protein